MPGSLGLLLNRLAATTNRIVARFGTDDFLVLRASKTGNGRGGTKKEFEPTTEEPHGCFYSVYDAGPKEQEEVRAARRAPVIFRRFVCQTGVDVTHADRLRLVARADVPEIDLEIVRVAPLSGVLLEVITVEELKADDA